MVASHFFARRVLVYFLSLRCCFHGPLPPLWISPLVTSEPFSPSFHFLFLCAAHPFNLHQNETLPEISFCPFFFSFLSCCFPTVAVVLATLHFFFSYQVDFFCPLLVFISFHSFLIVFFSLNHSFSLGNVINFYNMSSSLLLLSMSIFSRFFFVFPFFLSYCFLFQQSF